jgi:hypothetical protein
LGADNHLKIMNSLSNILNEVNGTDTIILGLGDAGRHSETLPAIFDNSASAFHPCNVYGSSCFSMVQT